MDEIKITPLGTVSPYPKNDNNCPGFLIEYNGERLLLDCGSGTARLLNMPQDLENLSIYITHDHLDHYSDINSLAYASYTYHKLGLLIIIFNKDLRLINLSYLKDLHYFEFYNLTNNFNSSSLSYLENIHDTPCYSIKITTKEGIKVVYTSDTGYNKELIKFSEDADLLICESTFLKGQKGSKNHLYAYEAGQIAKLAKVKQLMLTHFWPEIPKSEYVKEASEYFKNVTAAEENKTLILRRP